MFTTIIKKIMSFRVYNTITSQGISTAGDQTDFSSEVTFSNTTVTSDDTSFEYKNGSISWNNVDVSGKLAKNFIEAIIDDNPLYIESENDNVVIQKNDGFEIWSSFSDTPTQEANVNMSNIRQLRIHNNMVHVIRGEKSYLNGSTLNNPKQLGIYNNYLFMSMHQGLGGVEIWEIVQNNNLNYISVAMTGDSVNATHAYQDYMYLALNNNIANKAEIWDISNITNPTRVGTITTGGQMFDSAISDDGRYFMLADTTSGTGLWVYDTIDKTNPSLVYSDNFSGGGVCYKDNTIYITDFTSNNVRIYNADDFNSISFITTIGSFGAGINPVPVNCPDSDFIFVQSYNASNGQFWIVDVSDRTNPSIESTVTGSGVLPFNGGVVEYNGQIYAFRGQNTTTNSNMTVYDITDPANPSTVYTYHVNNTNSRINGEKIKTIKQN